MKKIVLVFGLIAGLICGGMFFLHIPDVNSPESMDMENGQLIGYITMIIALSSIFFAVKQYRDNHLNGSIKFGKAFLIGLYITLVASVVYVLAWEIYYTNFASDFGDIYVSHVETKMLEEGKEKAEVEKQIATLQQQMESYENNILVRFGFTFLEIFPVGLIISLICGLIFGVFLKSKADANNTAVS